MDFKSLFSLCLAVLSDWRVIAITLFLIFYISLAGYVVRYTKKPKLPKVKKIPEQSAPPPAEGEAPKEGE